MAKTRAKAGDTTVGDTSASSWNDVVSAVREAPEAEAAWAALEELAAQGGTPDEVGGLYREFLHADLPPRVHAMLGRRAIRFHEEWFGEESPLLVEVLSRVAEVDPTASEDTFARLTVVHTALEQWDELLALYDRAIERAADDAERIRLLTEAAQAAKDFAGNATRATAYLERLLVLRPGDPQVVASLERLFERQGRYEDLVELWRSRMGDLAPAEVRRTRLRIARVLLERLGRAEDALREARPCIDDPQDDAAEACAILEGILSNEDAPLVARRQAFSLLKGRYDAEGREADGARILDKALSFVSDEDAVALRREAAERLVGEGSLSSAIEHYVAILALHPGSVEARDGMRLLAERTGEHERRVLALVRAAEAATGALSVSLRIEAAEVRRFSLADPKGAVELYTRVLESGELDRETAASISRKLAELYEEIGQPDARLSVLERLAVLETDPSERRGVLARVARLAESLGRTDRALTAWEARLELDAADLEALDAVIALLEREEHWGPLAEALRRRAAVSPSIQQRRIDLVRIASLAEEKLDDLRRSIATWREVANLFGEDAETVDALSSLYERTNAWDELTALLERTTEREASHLANVRSRLGSVYRERLGDATRAALAYRRTLDADPVHAEARRGLESLLENPETRLTAVAGLSTAFAATGDEEGLLRILEWRLEAAPSIARKVEILREAASVLEIRASDAAGALATIGRALVLAPEDETLEAEVMRLAESTKRFDVASSILGDAASALRGDARRAAHLHRARAALLELKISDPEKAFESYVASLLDEPSHEETAEALVRTAEASDRLADAEKVLEKAADRSHATPKLLRLLAGVQRRQPTSSLARTLERIASIEPNDLDLLSEASTIVLQSLDDRSWARALLERLYADAARLFRAGAAAAGEREAGSTTLATIDALLPLYEALEAHDAAVRLLLDAARLPVDADRSRAFRRMAASIASERMGDRRLSIDLARDVLAESKDDLETIAVLSALYEAEGRIPELLALRRHELSLARNADRRLALRLDIARLHGELETHGGRVESLRENLDERPGHRASLDALEALLLAQGRFVELVTILEQQASRLEAAGEPSPAATLLRRAAELAEQSLGDSGRAIAAHRRAVELVPAADGYDALARLHLEKGDPTQAARWLERRLGVAEDAERTPVALRLAEVLLAAGKGERATEVLEQARALDPANVEVQELLAKEYRKREAWEKLAVVLSEGARVLEEPNLVLSRVREAAYLFHQRLGAPARAVDVLARGVSMAPDDRELRALFGESLRHAGRLDEARENLTTLVEQFGRRRSPDRAAAHHELARVLHAQGELEEAIENLELATKMDLGNADMLQMLGRLAREAGQLDRAERAFRALLLLQRRGTGESSSIGATEVLWELHAISLLRGDEAQARELRESALESASQSPDEAHRLKEALLAQGEADVALRLLERCLSTITDPAAEAGLLSDLADVLERGLGRTEEAFERRLESVRKAGDVAAIHEGARALARRLDKTAAYVDAVRALAESLRRKEDAAVAAWLWIQAGLAVEEDLDDAVAAVELYGRAEATGTRLSDAWRAIARAAAKSENRGEQERVLELLVSTFEVEPAVRADALYTLAEIELGSESSIEQGLVRLRDALRASADPLRACALLQSVFDRGGDPAVLELFGEVARSANDDASLVAYLDRKTRTDDASLGDVREAIDRADALDRGALAEEFLARAVRIARARDEVTEARWALLGLAGRREAAGDLSAAMGWLKEAAEIAVGEEAVQLELRLANLARGEGGDPLLAMSAYERLLERDSADARVWAPLLELYRTLGEEEKLRSLARTVIDGLLDPALRNQVRMEVVRHLLTLPERDFEAVELLREILDEEPDHAEGAKLLAQLYERSGYDEELVELLERQLDAARDAEDAGQVAALSIRLGGLLERVRRDDAKDVYRRALEFAPSERTLIEALLALLGPEDDARERTQLRERLLATEEGDDGARLARELYAEWREFGDVEGMQRVLEVGFARFPDEELRVRLEAWYREREQWAPLAELLATHAARIRASEPGSAMASFLESAALRREKLDDVEGAIAMLREARGLDGSDYFLLEELVRVIAAAGRLEEALDEITSALGSGTMDESRVPLLQLRARLLGDLARDGEAVADLEAAFALAGREVAPELLAALDVQRTRASASGAAEVERVATLRLTALYRGQGESEVARRLLSDWLGRHPSDRDALHELRDLDLASGNWEAIAATAYRLIEVESGEDQIEAAMLLADATRAKGTPADARRGLERTYRDQPDHPRLRDRLKRLYEECGALAELAQLLYEEARISAPSARFGLLRDVGEMFLYRAGDPSSAVSALEAARELAPDDHRTTVILADAYTSAARYVEAGQLLEQAIGAHGRRRSPELSELQHRMARLAATADEQRLQLDWLAAALESDKNNADVAAELAELAMSLGEHDVAMNALRAITLMKNEGPMSRAMAFLLQAKIAHEKGETRRAVLWARKALSEDPALAEANDFLRALGEA